MFTIKAFDPSSYDTSWDQISCKSKSLNSKVEEIDNALNELRLEDAKNAIYKMYGIKSIKTQAQLLRIVQKLVELNANKLSAQHEQLNHTLESAYSLSCRIYHIAFNNNPDCRNMDLAVQALTQVAEAQANKKEYQKAVHTLRKINHLPINLLLLPVSSMLARWKHYIDNECSPENKPVQNHLYKLRDVRIL